MWPVKDRKDYAPLVAKNLFVRGYKRAAEAPNNLPGRTLPGEEDPRGPRLAGQRRVGRRRSRSQACGMSRRTRRPTSAKVRISAWRASMERSSRSAPTFVTLEVKGEIFSSGARRQSDAVEKAAFAREDRGRLQPETAPHVGRRKTVDPPRPTAVRPGTDRTAVRLGRNAHGAAQRRFKLRALRNDNRIHADRFDQAFIHAEARRPSGSPSSVFSSRSM